VHHRLYASPDRAESSQAHQVQGGGAQRGHDAGTIAPLAVGILVELGVPDPVPALMFKRSRTTPSRASAVVRRLVRNR
jgi:hypothetical protein